MTRLSRKFYEEDTVEVAKKLLGRYMVRVLDGELLVGRITETEAYIGRCDKACHAYNYRKTERTAPLFGPPGHAYIYLIYGMYHCLNFVTERAGEPAAVLIRSVEPVAGTDTVRRLRFGDRPMTAYRKKNFLNGPGKVCQGFSLTRAENRMDLTGGTLFVCDSPADVGLPCPAVPKERLLSGPRIGVDYAEEARDFPWRFRLEPLPR
jgi:DNA-3-methyladenine glycosylase